MRDNQVETTPWGLYLQAMASAETRASNLLLPRAGLLSCRPRSGRHLRKPALRIVCEALVPVEARTFVYWSFRAERRWDRQKCGRSPSNSALRIVFAGSGLRKRPELPINALSGLDSSPAAPNQGGLWGNQPRGLFAKLWHFLRPELVNFIQCQVPLGSILMRTTFEELGTEVMNYELWPWWRPEFWCNILMGWAYAQ